MARTQGQTSFPVSLEPQVGVPLDARGVVTTLADLTASSTFLATDGTTNTSYVGMLVAVTNDSTSENNGVYRLHALPPTSAGNWWRLAHLAGAETFTDLKTLQVGLNVGGGTGGNIKPHSARGFFISGITGSSYDFALLNPAENGSYMYVPSGSQIPVFGNGLSVSNTGNYHVYYGSTHGLGLRGIAGSPYDMAALNPGATAYYWRVPTGTNVPEFPQGINMGAAYVYYSSTAGLTFRAAAGTSYDIAAMNPAATAYYWRVPTGTNVPQFPNGLAVGTQTATLYEGAAQGTIIRGVTGTSYDFSLLNPANTDYYMRVPTGTNVPQFPNGLTSSTDLYAATIHTGPTSASSTNGGCLRVHDDTGAFRWRVGMGATAAAVDFIIQDWVNSRVPLSISAASGAVTMPYGVHLGGSNLTLAKSAVQGLAIKAETGSSFDLSLINPTNSQYYAVVPTGSLVPRFPQGWQIGTGAACTSWDEGSWTPTATNLGGSGITYSTKWLRRGNETICSITITGTALTSTANSTTLSLPFTPARVSVGGVITPSQAQQGLCVVQTTGVVNLPTLTSTTSIMLTFSIFHN